MNRKERRKPRGGSRKSFYNGAGTACLVEDLLYDGAEK